VREVGTGTVRRVDPTKNEVVATIYVGSGCCLAVGEGAVWATVPIERRLLRIDPVSNRVTATIPVGDQADFSAVAFGSVWVSNKRGGTVTRINPMTNRPVAEISITPILRGGPNFLGRAGDSLWVGVPARGEIVRIDPATNKVTGALKIPGAGCHHLASNGSTLWLARGCDDMTKGDKIWKIDTRRMKVTAIIKPGGYVGAPAFWKGQLWVLTSRHLVSINPKTNRVVVRAVIPGSGGDWAAVADGSLWVANPGKLLRLRLQPSPARPEPTR
jgi:glutamine cyclotransferase